MTGGGRRPPWDQAWMGSGWIACFTVCASSPRCLRRFLGYVFAPCGRGEGAKWEGPTAGSKYQAGTPFTQKRPNISTTPFVCFPRFSRKISHFEGQITNLDARDPSLPLWDVVQDLCRTDSTKEIMSLIRSCRLYGSHTATWARSYRSGIYLPCLADLDHEVVVNYTDRTDHLSEVCCIFSCPEVWFGGWKRDWTDLFSKMTHPKNASKGFTWQCYFGDQ